MHPTGAYMTLDSLQMGLYQGVWPNPFLATVIASSQKVNFQLQMNRYKRHGSVCNPAVTSNDYLECQRRAALDKFLERASCSNCELNKPSLHDSLKSSPFFSSMHISPDELPIPELEPTLLSDQIRFPLLQGGLSLGPAGFQLLLHWERMQAILFETLPCPHGMLTPVLEVSFMSSSKFSAIHHPGREAACQRQLHNCVLQDDEDSGEAAGPDVRLQRHSRDCGRVARTIPGLLLQ